MRALLLTVAIPSTAAAVEWELSVDNSFFLESLPEDVLVSRLRFAATSTATSDRIAYHLHALGSLAGRPIDEIGLAIGLDTGLIAIGDRVLINDREPSDALRRTLFLGETFADVQLLEGTVDLQIGKLRPRIGRGAIFDAYAFGLLIDVDTTLLPDPHPWSARLWAILPNGDISDDAKRSPLFDLELAYHFDRRSEIRLIAAVAVEGNDGLSPILGAALVRGRASELVAAGEDFIERLPPVLRAEARQRLEAAQVELARAVAGGGIGYEVETSGVVGWSGLSSSIGLGALEIGALALVGFGRIEADVAPNDAYEDAIRASLPRFPSLAEALIERQTSAQTIDLLSYYLSIDASYELVDDLTVQVFGIAMSGDESIPSPVADPSRGRTYNGFVSIAPYVPRSRIFFGGTVSTALSSPTAASLAPDGAGLFAGGFGADWTIIEALSLAGNVALMASSVTRDAYGVEVDLELRGRFTSWLYGAASGALFIPGTHFGDVPLGYQATAALELAFGDR